MLTRLFSDGCCGVAVVPLATLWLYFTASGTLLDTALDVCFDICLDTCLDDCFDIDLDDCFEGAEGSGDCSAICCLRGWEGDDVTGAAVGAAAGGDHDEFWWAYSAAAGDANEGA